MRSLVRIAALALPVACACAGSSTELTCESCEIQLEYLTTLGDDGDGPGAIPSYPTSIAQDSKGRYFVTAPYTGEERPYVFNAAGAFQSRLGGIGEGPREFQQADYLSVSKDSVLVYDGPQARIAVYSPDLRYVRSLPGIPPLYRWIEFPDGTLLANRTDYRSPPLVHLGRSGELVTEFGAAYEEFDRSAWLRPVRYIAPSSSGGVWSVQLAFSFVIREWDRGGNLIRTVEPETEWFQEHDVPRNPSPDETPQSRINGIWEDDRGLLWIVGTAASTNWSDGLGQPRRIEGQDVHEVVDPDLVYDTVIEVLDPDAEEPVLYHRRLEEGLMWPVQPGVLAVAEETELGFYRIKLFQADLLLP